MIKRIFFLIIISFLYACQEKKKPQFDEEAYIKQVEKEKKEVITQVELSSKIDEEMVKQGEMIFVSKCTLCHQIETKAIGPKLKGVTERRKPEWIMNMVLDPDRMIKEDSIAKNLTKEYPSPMTNQNLTKEEARAVLEYLRTKK